MSRDHSPSEDVAGGGLAPPAVRRAGGEPSFEPSEDPDRELTARAAAGDNRAMETLLVRHYDRIYRVAWRMTGRREDAEDIAQEVCRILVEKIGTFKGEARFTTWLTGIVMNAGRDLHRRSASWSNMQQFLKWLVGLPGPAREEDHYTRIWLTSELARLDPKYRKTIVAVFGEGMTHREVASALGVAEATVSGWIHELRLKLGADGKDATDEG